MEFTQGETLTLFGFDKICERISANCRTVSSKRMAAGLKPETDREELLIVLKQTDELTNTLKVRGYFPDTSFDDFLTESNLLFIAGSMLTEDQFSRIRSASGTVNTMLHFFAEKKASYPYLSLLSSGLFETSKIIEQIDMVIDLHGQVKDNASDELYAIRSRLISGRREADRKFRSFIADAKKRGWLRENEENFYNNRRVLAVPSEFRRELRGIVHGKSDSGKTTFIEPEALVELNNEIAELEQDERSEVIRLLRQLTDDLRDHRELIANYHRFLTMLDFIRAKALFAISTESTLPRISTDSVVSLVNARHPLLLLQNETTGKPVVPLTLTLNSDQRILIISGPNAGGKSITLKTVGLLQIMLQSGILVPASEESEMCFFNGLLADIGDSQSIENALSTYSSRLIRMNQFMRDAGRKTLVLIDEFGTGTDPELGGAIAEVVLEELNRKKTFGIFTTHYTNIKLLADNLEGVFNGSMLFDPETLEPKYKLISGQPGSSYTFEVAEKIGLPQHVLNRAKKRVQHDKIKLNGMLSALHQQKHELEIKLRALEMKERRASLATGRFEELSKKLEEKLSKDQERREETGKLIQLGRKLLALTDEWEKSKDRKAVIKKFVGAMTAEKKRRAAENTPGKLEKKRLALVEKLKDQIHVGSMVRMLKGKQVGVVEDIRKNIVHVNFGTMKASVAIENLEPADNGKQRKKPADKD